MGNGGRNLNYLRRMGRRERERERAMRIQSGRVLGEAKRKNMSCT